MAITFITSPNDWQNAYNEIVFNVSSNNSTQPNFQFLVDVNVSGQTNPVARLTYPKQVGVGTINIDVANVLKDYVTYDIVSFNVSGILPNNNSIAKYWLEFGEVYDNVSGVPVIYPNLAQYGTSGTPKNSSNAIFDFLQWSKTAFNTGKVLSIGNKVSLNQSTFTPSLRANQQLWLTFFDLNAVIRIVDLNVYNSQENRIFGNSYSYSSSVSGIVSTNIGFEFLEFMSASGYMTNPNAAYYEVKFKDNADDPFFTKRINIDQTCTKYEVYRLHWLNNLGGFDSFNFTKVSKESVEIERKQFKKFQQLNYAKTDRLKTNYFTKFSENIELNSDLLTDAEWEGLRELLLSPIVILEVDKDTYYPVNILETNYPINKVINETRPTSLLINIQYTFDNYRQSL
jgi:hypothetical protein